METDPPKRKAEEFRGDEPSPKRARTNGDNVRSNKEPQPSVGTPKDDKKPVNGGPKTITAASLASLPRAKKAVTSTKPITSRRPDQSPNSRKRSCSPAKDSAFTSRRDRRRTPPQNQRTTSPEPLRRSPSPGDRSPPRERKRPGAGARVNVAERDALKRRQEQREQDRRAAAQQEAAARGVHDVVRQHYNAVPQRGTEWRKTESKIKGLRSLNNWIKSAVIQKFSPNEGHDPGARQNGFNNQDQDLCVLDIGCGKGGDLQKWHAAPQTVGLYIGLDPAEISIDQGRGRWEEMRRGPQRGRDRRPLFKAEFIVKDCFGSWLGDIPIVRSVGIDGGVGPDGDRSLSRFGGGGFDVVSMMFCMHYAFENEAKARMMLRNVAGSLKKGGRFLGVIPNSDVIVAKLAEYNEKKGLKPVVQEEDSDNEWDPEKPTESKPVAPEPNKTGEAAVDGEKEETLEWGNDIYRVRIPNASRLPTDGIFRPPFGHKYFYFLEEAVEEVPEYIVPWEAFRAMAVDYDLELQYQKPFNEIWEDERGDRTLGPLSERMGVVDRDTGRLKVSPSEMDAATFYTAFCFYKV